MAYLDTGGTGSMQSLVGIASVVVTSWAVSLIEPGAGITTPTTTAVLKLLVSSTSATNTDVQVQVATEVTFASPVLDQTISDKADGFHSVSAAGLTNLTTYYWRARAAETGTTSWTAWTPIWIFRVNTAAGTGSEYVNLNVGFDPIHEDVAAEYVNANVGIELTHEDLAAEYVNANIGIEQLRETNAVEYIYEGDVDTSTPNPRIWFVAPDNGRAGDGVQVYGFGFGDLAVTYSGVLQWKNGDTWEGLSVTTWQTFPPGPNAYTADREMDVLAPKIDMQYTMIEFQIPSTALPPGFSLRVVTDGA